MLVEHFEGGVSVTAAYIQIMQRLFGRQGKANVTASSWCFCTMQMFHLSTQDNTDGWLVGLLIDTLCRHFYLNSNVPELFS